MRGGNKLWQLLMILMECLSYLEKQELYDHINVPNVGVSLIGHLGETTKDILLDNKD